MVAYSFQARFVEPILSGRKAGTVRAHRKRHALPGEELQLYTGMRTKHCRLIARAQCQAVVRIRMVFRFDTASDADVLYIEGKRATFAVRQAFAIGDGFKSWAELRAFWCEHHRIIPDFDGVWIKWAFPSGGMLEERP